MSGSDFTKYISEICSEDLTSSFDFSQFADDSLMSDINSTWDIDQQTIYPPPPPIQSAQSSTELINNLLQLQILQDTQLRNIREKQKILFEKPDHNIFNNIYTEEKTLLAQLESEMQAIEGLLSQVLLLPSELHRVDYLRNEFTIQINQIQLYINEIEQLPSQQRALKPLAVLIISKQPFPEVPSKNNQLGDGELIVQLLTGATVNVLQCSPIKCILITENIPTKSTDNKMIANDIQPLDINTLKAKFPIIFSEGTRKNAAHLRFIMDVQLHQSGQQVSGTLETINNSSPFLVMTNQKQWEGCERTLLMRDAFEGKLEISWIRFANTLQRQFIRATKQDPQNPTRCLSQFDFAYLHEKFLLKRPIFPQKDYNTFWDWYGKCMQVIKYQRHIGSLWQTGLLYGFMTREEVTMALSEENPGTFIMRFSERHAGQIGIAYVGNQINHIKHYLVQPNDTAAAKFTLPDFLRDKPQFAYMLKFTLLASGTPQFNALPKDQLLENLYSRRTTGDTSGSGYDPLT